MLVYHMLQSPHKPKNHPTSRRTEFNQSNLSLQTNLCDKHAGLYYRQSGNSKENVQKASAYLLFRYPSRI